MDRVDVLCCEFDVVYFFFYFECLCFVFVRID